MAVTNCNIDMESLITDQNRSIATLAITTLLKTGAAAWALSAGCLAVLLLAIAASNPGQSESIVCGFLLKAVSTLTLLALHTAVIHIL
jgi:CBS-domain-containing membrane protein